MSIMDHPDGPNGPDMDERLDQPRPGSPFPPWSLGTEPPSSFFVIGFLSLCTRFDSIGYMAGILFASSLWGNRQWWWGEWGIVAVVCTLLKQ